MKETLQEVATLIGSFLQIEDITITVEEEI
jgi:hypothetical protein